MDGMYNGDLVGCLELDLVVDILSNIGRVRVTFRRESTVKPEIIELIISKFTKIGNLLPFLSLNI